MIPVQLSKREKNLLMALGGLILLSILYFIISGMGGYAAEQKRQAERMEQLQIKVQALDASIKTSGPVRGNQASSKSLIERIELLSNVSNLKDKLQLNRVPLDKARGVEGIEIKMDGLSLDEMVHFIFSIEHAKPQIIIEQVELTQSFKGKGRLRLSMRVLAQL